MRRLAITEPMNRLVRTLFHTELARDALVWLGRARRGRLSGATRTPMNAVHSIRQPFFIVGSGRSGNTLVRAILHGHSRLAVPPESYVLGRVAWLGRLFRDDPWELQVDRLVSAFDTPEVRATWHMDLSRVSERLLVAAPDRRGVDAVVDAVYREWLEEHAPGANRWGDKTPLNALYLPWLDELFPGAAYIHVLRDGRDVALSYVRAGLYETLEAGARRWRESVEHVRRFSVESARERLVEVRYEDLVEDPERHVVGLCRFLGVEPEAGMMEFWRGEQELGDTHLPHHANVGGPITSEYVGRWRELPASDLRRLESALGRTLRRTGYA